MESPSVVILSCLLGILLFVGFRFHFETGETRKKMSLPPGPPSLPFIGHLLSFPRSQIHVQMAKWAKTYGDILCLRIMHLKIIIVNSPDSVKEIIDKRSNSTSGRPISRMVKLLSPSGLNFATSQHTDETWRLMRKAATHMLRPENLVKFKSYQRAEAIQLVWDILQRPSGFYHHIDCYTTSLFMGLIYGYRLPSSPEQSDQFVRDFLKLQYDFQLCVEVGKAPPVDLFPFLTWIPACLAPWKRQAITIGQKEEALFLSLWNKTKERIENGTRVGNVLEDLYLHQTEWNLSEQKLLHLGGTLLKGSTTVSAILQGIILCLSAHPDIQAKAHKEIDTVVGHDRLPDFQDLDKLEYIKAIIEEYHRFKPIGPLGLPHAISEEIQFEGLTLPKYAALFINLWGIFHDSRYYDNPERFEPERFMRHPLGIRGDIQDNHFIRENLVFGGGRRVCPGIWAGKTCLELNLANILWAFTIEPPRSPSGKITIPDLDKYMDGLSLTPFPFEAEFHIRSPEIGELINHTFHDQSTIFEEFV